MIRFVLALFLSISLTPAAFAQDDADTQAKGRALAEKFLAGDTDSLWSRMTDEMQKALVSRENFATFRTQVRDQLGEEQELVRESVVTEGGYRVYVRVSRWTDFNEPIRLQFAFDASGAIAGFFVRPDAAVPSPPKEFDSPHLDYDTKANLRLPFEGEWFVFWGGRRLADNYHAQDRTQRFAYDFVKAEAGSTHRGDGKKREDYYAWDQPILAPADGTVVTIVDGLEDQVPGSFDTKNAAGNFVLVDFGNEEFALLAHLKNGSLKVGPGDTVKRGQELARCGNSGNTSEPHLHFHLQNSRRPLVGDGLPAQFTNFFENEVLVERGEPTRGNVISNAVQ